MLEGTPKMFNSSNKFNRTAQCNDYTNYLLCWSFSSLSKARITTPQLTPSSGKN